MPFRLLEYRLPGGWQVLVGRTDAANDYLSVRLAQPEDWWFHVHGLPGSHVVLRARPDLEPDRRTLEGAAAIAAWHSRARAAGVTPVTCARARDVSKPRGAQAGTVAVRRERILKVRPGLPPGDPGGGD